MDTTGRGQIQARLEGLGAPPCAAFKRRKQRPPDQPERRLEGPEVTGRLRSERSLRCRRQPEPSARDCLSVPKGQGLPIGMNRATVELRETRDERRATTRRPLRIWSQCRDFGAAGNRVSYCSFLSPEKNRGEIRSCSRAPVSEPSAHSRGQKRRKATEAG